MKRTIQKQKEKYIHSKYISRSSFGSFQNEIVESKYEYLFILETYRENFQKHIFLAFSLESLAQNRQCQPLYSLLQSKTTLKFLVTFLHNVSSNHVCIAVEKTNTQKIKSNRTIICFVLSHQYLTQSWPNHTEILVANALHDKIG